MTDDRKIGAPGWIGLVVWIAIVAAAAAFGGQFMPGEWYAGLNKPSWNPPNWIFGPVWTTLYLMMAIAAWLVWLRRKVQPVYPALAVFVVQLLLNGAWSWIFFGLHRIDVAFGEILVLDLLILVTVLLFWRIRWLAGALLVPYLLWTSFASFLNFTIWRLNL
ncbi:MAG: tryptophan-rich sensory protein [Candidatus Hydrogenedentes bacterium]|nr:tryptophan-rich sensory protein [Candidatus Hydrogenedentota bacterium]